MSSDLLEIDDDMSGNSISLTMNVHGYAFLNVSDGSEFSSYTFEPTSVGIQKALKVAHALEDWAKHVSGSLNGKEQ